MADVNDRIIALILEELKKYNLYSQDADDVVRAIAAVFIFSESPLYQFKLVASEDIDLLRRPFFVDYNHSFADDALRVIDTNNKVEKGKIGYIKPLTDIDEIKKHLPKFDSARSVLNKASDIYELTMWAIVKHYDLNAEEGDGINGLVDVMNNKGLLAYFKPLMSKRFTNDKPFITDKESPFGQLVKACTYDINDHLNTCKVYRRYNNLIVPNPSQDILDDLQAYNDLYIGVNLTDRNLPPQYMIHSYLRSKLNPAYLEEKWGVSSYEEASEETKKLIDTAIKASIKTHRSVFYKFPEDLLELIAARKKEFLKKLSVKFYNDIDLSDLSADLQERQQVYVTLPDKLNDAAINALRKAVGLPTSHKEKQATAKKKKKAPIRLGAAKKEDVGEIPESLLRMTIIKEEVEDNETVQRFNQAKQTLVEQHIGYAEDYYNPSTRYSPQLLSDAIWKDKAKEIDYREEFTKKLRDDIESLGLDEEKYAPYIRMLVNPRLVQLGEYQYADINERRDAFYYEREGDDVIIKNVSEESFTIFKEHVYSLIKELRGADLIPLYEAVPYKAVRLLIDKAEDGDEDSIAIRDRLIQTLLDKSITNQEKYAQINEWLKPLYANVGHTATDIKTEEDQKLDDLLVGKSDHMQEIKRKIADIAKLDNISATTADKPSIIYIQGESGTGKQKVAEAIHQMSRAGKPFVTMVITRDQDPRMFTSELCGVGPHAYTGASSKAQPGKIAMAKGGDLFIDELQEASPAVISQLKPILSEGKYNYLGERIERKVECRIIIASNRDIKTLERFADYEDIVARLYSGEAVFKLKPITEREDDIPLLAKDYLAKLNIKRNTDIAISQEAIAVIIKHIQTRADAGNIRTIQSLVTTGHNNAVANQSDIILPQHLAEDRTTQETVLKHIIIRMLENYAKYADEYDDIFIMVASKLNIDTSAIKEDLDLTLEPEPEPAQLSTTIDGDTAAKLAKHIEKFYRNKSNAASLTADVAKIYDSFIAMSQGDIQDAITNINNGDAEYIEELFKITLEEFKHPIVDSGVKQTADTFNLMRSRIIKYIKQYGASQISKLLNILDTYGPRMATFARAYGYDIENLSDANIATLLTSFFKEMGYNIIVANPDDHTELLNQITETVILKEEIDADNPDADLTSLLIEINKEQKELDPRILAAFELEPLKIDDNIQNIANEI